MKQPIGIRIIVSVLLLSFISICYSQQDGILPNTVVFKLKEEYRSKSSNNQVEVDSFKEILSKLGSTNLQKIFPNKQKEAREGFVDLSLIYQLTYSSQYSENEVIRLINKSKIAVYVEPYVIPELCYTPNDTE